jgi:hypothetical protein
MPTDARPPVSRRHVLQILAALGITGPLAADLAAQARPAVDAATLEAAAALVGGTFDDARMTVAQKAVQRNLESFEVVRELDIDDQVEPPVVFAARR